MASKDFDEIAEKAHQLSRRLPHLGGRDLEELALLVERLAKQVAAELKAQERAQRSRVS